MGSSCDYACLSPDNGTEKVTNVLQLVLRNISDPPTTATNVLTTWSGIHHPYWANFTRPSHEVHITIGFVMAVIGVLAISGNSFVIFIFLRFRSLRTPGNLLMINLAASDLLMAVTGFPLYATASFYGRWIYPDAVCLLYGACGATFGLLSINSLAAIAVDRYLVIAHSYSLTNRTNKRQAIVMIIISWINSLIWALPPLFGWNRYILEGFGTTCSFDYLSRSRLDRTFVMLMFVCGFAVPLLMIIGSYAYIFWVVHRHEQMFRIMSQTLKARIIHGGKEATQRTEMRTARTIILAVLFYCVSWTPYAAISLIGLYGKYQLLTPLVTAVPGVLAKMSTIYNPFLYTFSHPRFRKKVLLLIFKKSPVHDRTVSHMDTNGKSILKKLKKGNESMQAVVETMSATSSWSDEFLPKQQRNNFPLRDASEHTDTMSLASSYKMSDRASTLSLKSRHSRPPCKIKKDWNKNNKSGKKGDKMEERMDSCCIEETTKFLESKETKDKIAESSMTLESPVETVV